MGRVRGPSRTPILVKDPAFGPASPSEGPMLWAATWAEALDQPNTCLRCPGDFGSSSALFPLPVVHEPSPVRAVRIRLDLLRQGEEVRLVHLLLGFVLGRVSTRQEVG